MEHLSAIDNVFLWLERPVQPLHVAGLQIFAYPEGVGRDYVTELAEYCRQHRQPTAPFDVCLNSEWGLYRWQQDSNFDIDHHFRHVALPKPGGPKELMSFISAEHGNLLDRARPLWETYLIEAMHGRHFAVYTKVHHSLVDGVSAMRVATRILSNDPEQRGLPAPWHIPPQPKKTVHHHEAKGFFARMGDLATTLSTQAKAIPGVVSALKTTVQNARQNPDLQHVFTAPRCRLNQPITGSRRVAAQSFPMARFKALASKADATTNDIIVAVCSSALRAYLLSLNDLPAEPLVAMVPMSWRKDESAGGNQITAILANLATHIADPAQRLAVIKQSLQEGKQRFSAMTPEQIIDYTALTLAPTGLSVLTGMMPQWFAFNVIISNVPGPKETCYWNGAKLEHLFPVSIVANHMALNITIITYADKLEFGIVGCRRTLPSLQRLLNHIEDSILELEKVLTVGS